ncbi:MAG: hypothetical protein IJC29_03605 [Clostridia bacterium]|nr:hypothetical protein [Clostridia bacterium]
MLSFIKYASAGRSYLLYAGEEALPRGLCAALCHPVTGVGASGVLTVCEAERADGCVGCHLPDGEHTVPDTAALSCAAKYLYDSARVNRTELCLSFSGGSRRMTLESYGGVARCVRAELGYPVLDGASIPCRYPRLTRGRPVILGGSAYSLTCLRIGSPFACLTGEAAPPPDALAPLQRDFPSGVTVLYTERAGDALVGEVLLSLPSPVCHERCACALAVANAIEGRAPFEAPLSVAVGGECFSLTLSTRLAMSLCLPVREVCRCQIDAEELCLP